MTTRKPEDGAARGVDQRGASGRALREQSEALRETLEAWIPGGAAESAQESSKEGVVSTSAVGVVSEASLQASTREDFEEFSELAWSPEEEEALREAALGESQHPSYSSLLEAAALLRHSEHPPVLEAISFERVGQELFGEDFARSEALLASGVLEREQQAGEVTLAGVSWWSRLRDLVWPSAAGARAWRVAAFSGAFVVLLGIGLPSLLQQPAPTLRSGAVQRQASRQQGPWAPGVNPFRVTRHASERLDKVLRYHQERRQDGWIHDMRMSLR